MRPRDLPPVLAPPASCDTHGYRPWNECPYCAREDRIFDIGVRVMLAIAAVTFMGLVVYAFLEGPR